MIPALDNLSISDAKKKSATSALPTCTKKLKLEAIALDFETAYSAKYSLEHMGTWEYVNDPRFKAIQVAAYCDKYSASTTIAKFPWRELDGVLIVAHNATFDKAVFDRLQELGEIPADIKPRDWLCTSALSRFMNGPSSLKDCAKAWLGEEMDKSVRSRMCGTGDLFDDVATYALNDARICWKLWFLLEKAWPEKERKLYKLTRAMGNYGVHVDMDYIESCIKILNKMVVTETLKLPWAARGKPALSVDHFKAACKNANIEPPESTAKNDTDLAEWKETHKDSEAVGWLNSMQQVRRANRTAKVFAAMRSRTMPGDRMAYELKYCGASTGRWSGTGGINMQNFNRDEVAEGIDLRSAIIAAPGNKLLIIDYSSIESRVLLWLAGDHDTLDILRTGMDIYEAHARRTMGYKDARSLKDVNKRMRQLAKARVLGLGYGCGAEKFIWVAKVMGGLDIEFDESRRIVNDYRNSNPLIISLWNRLEDAFRAKDNNTYRLPLPSGRKLRYYNVDGFDMTAQSVRGEDEEWFGGKLCENFVSAVSRDVLADAWLKMADKGLRVVMSVHDELVCEVYEGEAQDAYETMKEIMVTGPSWAEGLPLAVEGKITDRYEK